MGIVPDILTMAKGLTSSYAPMGCMAVSDPIAARFKENVFWGGLTYNAHCLGLATAEAVIEVMQDEGLGRKRTEDGRRHAPTHAGYAGQTPPPSGLQADRTIRDDGSPARPKWDAHGAL